MDRTKANFRATRETVGLSQGDMARLCGVSVTAVKRWEHPDGPQPPADAWSQLDTWLERHWEAVEQTVDLAVEIASQAGGIPQAVTLTYYRSQAEYDEAGRDPGFVGVVNARTLAVAQRLHDLGFAVEFVSPQDQAPMARA